ncbi:xanthine dehydrogenase family protein molybdopterin-binding subunit [Acetobacterium tundrae]|uniref:Molybdopterin-dependent oxidoreductase n=1 Tax=Acetobacterium tundrae TaxID=132932 RepID=A0ABR6WP09_9FIRM|nr:xanthine dehydrogenase family protein molybdopterin-binding subunit [Acetobacterium tundrae]MBC3798243.1 molybdopterin-dependent oxidoreductase [Acetobacterium tundrae]
MEKKPYRHIGVNRPRIDAREIVTGKAIFLDDFKMKEMLQAKVLRSPYPHAKITRIDISKAEVLPGIHAVLTHKNLPKDVQKWRLGNPPLIPVLTDTVHYVGDAVALVAADSVEIALEACDLIEVEYEQLEPVYYTQDAVKPDAVQIYPELPGNIVPEIEMVGEKMLTHLVRGDVDKALEEADYVEEGVYEYKKFASPMATEPPGVIMWMDKGIVKAYATTQAPEVYNMTLNMRTGMKVETKTFNVGGSFGNKSIMQTTSAYALALAVATGRPVKMYLTKSEQLLIHDMRIGCYMDCKIGLKDGIVTAVKGKWYLDAGALNDLGHVQIAVGMGEMQVALGKCKNWDMDAKVVVTNHVQTGSVRGFGGQEVKSTLMPLVMRAVAKANIDPVEFCINNFSETGDGWYWRDSQWYTAREQEYKHCMRSSAEKFGWSESWKGWNKPTRVEGNKVYGVGVSMHGNADVGEDNCEAYVRLESSGYVYLHNSIPEAGTGQRSNLRKYVAEVLDIEVEHVIVVEPSTENSPWDLGPAGSRSTLTTGHAVTVAAEDARKQLLEGAAKNIFHCPFEELETTDGMIYHRDNPENKVPWIAAFEHFGLTITGVGTYYSDYSKSNFGIYFSEVEVDLETGITKLVRVLVGSDVGQIIDPATLEMQVHGGFGAAAADSGLLEESVLDEYTGRLLTGNLIDYKWRTFDEFPPFDMVIEEGQPEISRFKAIGFGEISGAPGPASMMMAISNAIGKEFCEYPAHPRAILKALGKA